MCRTLVGHLAIFAVLGHAAADTVFERLAYHVVSTGSSTWEQFDFAALSGVVQFGGWDDALARRAREHGVAVFSEFGWACLPSQPCDWIANHTEAAQRAQAAADLATRRGADGINLDIEGAGRPHCRASDLEFFVREVKRRFSNGTGTIIVNVNAFPDAVSPSAGNAYNFTALSAHGAADVIAIMLYDMGWWNAGVPHMASANSPLDVAAHTLRRLVATGAVQHVPRERLVAVWPWYGYAFACNESAPLLAPCRSALPFCCGAGTAAEQISFAAATLSVGALAGAALC